MGFPFNLKLQPTRFLSLLLLLHLCVLHRHPPATTTASSPDYTKLIYKGCADQNFQDSSTNWKDTLKSVYNTLTSQSTKSNFSNTTAGVASQEPQIFGLYQCRGDLSVMDCHDCVSQFPKLSHKLCGDAIAVRVHLQGCYMKYEVVGFKQVSNTELLYKYCDPSSNSVDGGNASSSSSNSSSGNGGFDEKREAAFDAVEGGVAGNEGYYTSNSGGVVAVGQCEGDLAAGDCGDCVRTALERVKAECGEAVSGQVYLNRCYVSYSYYANGIQQGAAEKVSSPSSSGSRQRTQKAVAIGVGATAGAGFVLVVIMFARSILRKRKVSKPHGGGYMTHEYIYS